MSITSRSPRVIDFTIKATTPEVGPGSYDLPESITMPYESPYPFNTTAARSKDDINQNPGPADYSPSIPKLSIHGGISSIQSKSPRKSWDISNNPSPADYGKQYDWSGKPEKGSPSKREGMSSKSPRKGALINPQFHVTSPADYDTRLPYDRCVTIPKTARVAKKPWITPGPGQYETLKERTFSPNQSPAFMSHEERDIFKTPDWVVDYDGIGQKQWKLPDPGAPFGSRQKRKPFWSKNNNPSPCQYSVSGQRSFSPSPAPFMCGSSRGGLFDGNNNPGPADYKIEHKRRFKDSNSTPFFQNSERFVNKKPEYDACIGQYDVDMAEKIKTEKLKASPSAPFKAIYNRDPYKVSLKTPGVGSYTISNSFRSHRLMHCIDGTERSKPNTIFGSPIPETPGPAQYDETASERIVGGVMAKEGRRRPAQPGPENTPGPVAYVTPSSLFKPSFNVTYSTGKF